MSSRHDEVLIVGAGFAGLGAAVRLSADHDVAVIERAHDVGGTWRDNTYPGVACDIPAPLYSFSFHQSPAWTRVFAAGAEIQAYLRSLAARVAPLIELDTALLGADWDATAGLWRVETSRGERTADALVLACGRLAEPAIPRVPGLETFPGPIFHSARWDHGVELAGSRVAVVGSGASAVQLMPSVVEGAASVVQFQRSAPYIMPRPDHVFSDAERRLHADPAALDELRDRMFWAAEEGFAERIGDEARVAAARDRALAHLASQVTDAALRALLTPDYAIGCKRVLLSDDYYPAVSRPHVTLEPSAVASVDGAVVTGANGVGHEVDVLVFATGFRTAEQPYAPLVRAGGRSLAEHWSGGMRAYASTLVAGFPNLFVLDGPNAGLGHNSAITMIEAQIELTRRLLATAGVVEVDASREDAWTAEIDHRSAGTVWTTGGCESWYVDRRTGRLTLLWPGFAHEFVAALDDAACDLLTTGVTP
ncbi:NAD(P)/FAD-dependent oxidoreductase [Galbitalea sp. SE-J8]|uniref:flavin-containing monooxygenase n=1 Tax=Galbitalea sp. SE-J8 TaxID=3054952 RepID=UPI00259D1644|nr:NAD(P)/FAD-dependent oxidoreductase [Galbitalea sp. SE-J8]MDM4762172.1 NAD(P)/FAD-dependent oxidoreductase [Galbitalea sp. SE-J8]